MHDSITLREIQAYLNRGIHLCPIERGTKRPPSGYGVKKWRERYPSPETLRRWLREGHSLAAITGICSDLTALDIDPRMGGDDALNQLCTHHSLPPTLTTITPGDGITYGYHYYFQYRAGLTSRTYLPGLDIKTEPGGLVLLPGSLHKSGNRYRAMPGLGILDDAPIAAMPGWLLAALMELEAEHQAGKRRGRTRRPKLDLPGTASHGDLARAEQVAEFMELWGSLGIWERRTGDHRCPFHPDENPSFAIDFDRCVFRCRACGHQGGLHTLRQIAKTRDKHHGGHTTHTPHTVTRSSAYRGSERRSADMSKDCRCYVTKLLGSPKGWIVARVGEPRRSCPRHRDDAVVRDVVRIWIKVSGEARPLYLIRCLSDRRWRNVLADQIRDGGHDYVRFPAEQGSTILTTLPVDQQDLDLTIDNVLIAHLIDLVRGVAKGRRVTASRGWRTSSRGQKRYTDEGTSALAPFQILAIAKRRGLEGPGGLIHPPPEGPAREAFLTEARVSRPGPDLSRPGEMTPGVLAGNVRRAATDLRKAGRTADAAAMERYAEELIRGRDDRGADGSEPLNVPGP